MGILTNPDGKAQRIWCDSPGCPRMLAPIGQEPTHPSKRAQIGEPMTPGAIRYNLNQNRWASFPDDRQISEHGLDYCEHHSPQLN